MTTEHRPGTSRLRYRRTRFMGAWIFARAALGKGRLGAFRMALHNAIHLPPKARPNDERKLRRV